MKIRVESAASGFCERKRKGEKIYKFGYINERGEEVIPFQFYRANGFYNGVACVYNEDHSSGCIN